MLYRVHLVWARFELTTLVLIGTDCTGSCTSNYRMITRTPVYNVQHVLHIYVRYNIYDLTFPWNVECWLANRHVFAINELGNRVLIGLHVKRIMQCIFIPDPLFGEFICSMHMLLWRQTIKCWYLLLIIMNNMTTQIFRPIRIYVNI